MVSQYYVTEAENEYVIRGNSAVMKCKIPSFAADFVSVIAWVADDGQTYVHSYGADYGKCPSAIASAFINAGLVSAGSTPLTVSGRIAHYRDVTYYSDFLQW